ncbi:hypothetical protein [Duganella sp. Root1480D1]|nr:hypothetical protein [Duganella sp. Root1480D1]
MKTFADLGIPFPLFAVIPGLWGDQLHDDTGIYAFECSCCGRKTAHWDLA